MIVTGAAQGIGAGVTNAFLNRGYNVVANSLDFSNSAFTAGENLALAQVRHALLDLGNFEQPPACK